MKNQNKLRINYSCTTFNIKITLKENPQSKISIITLIENPCSIFIIRWNWLRGFQVENLKMIEI